MPVVTRAIGGRRNGRFMQEKNGPADRSHLLLVDLSDATDTTSTPRRLFQLTRRV